MANRHLIIRVPFLLLFGFHKGTQKRKKGQKSTTLLRTGQPSLGCLTHREFRMLDTP